MHGPEGLIDWGKDPAPEVQDIRMNAAQWLRPGWGAETLQMTRAAEKSPQVDHEHDLS